MRYANWKTEHLRAIRQILENNGDPVPLDLLAELGRRGEIVDRQ